MKNALIINAYEAYEGIGEGRLNRTIFEIAKETLEKKGYEVETTVIEEGYSIDEELQKNIKADVIFVNFPVYWFSIPALFKKYMDEVYAFAYANGFLSIGDGRTRSDSNKKYGSGGLKKGTKYMLTSTWNAPLEAFTEPGQFFEGKSADDILVGVHKTYQFFDMQALPSFEVYNVFKEPGNNEDLRDFRKHIESVF